jgi:hypothetical protein
MVGALLELVALGEQDKYLVGKPEISFFKSVYRQHTNFSKESKSLFFKEEANFGKRVSCIIERYGDLLQHLMLEIELPAIGSSGQNISWINSIGHHIIDEISIEIGGFLIDRFDGNWLEIYSEYNLSNSKQDGYYRMIGKNDVFSNVTQKNSMKLYIPIPFWFSKNIGEALPLIALQYHEVEVFIKFKDFNKCWFSGTDLNGNMASVSPSNLSFSRCRLYGDFIFLDVNERRQFAQSSHEYLIEQVQQNIKNNISDNSLFKHLSLTFNHPIKEIFWTIQNSEVSRTNDWNNFSNTPRNDSNPVEQVEILTDAIITINGSERFEKRNAEYFRLVQPYYHHTRIPKNFMYSYSFSISPEKHQPTGTLNFSRIDNAQLSLTCIANTNNSDINIYGVNYNILKIMSGMGGLLFSN